MRRLVNRSLDFEQRIRLTKDRAERRAKEELSELVHDRGNSLVALGWGHALVGCPERNQAYIVGDIRGELSSEGRIRKQRRQPHQGGLRVLSQGEQCAG